MRLPNVVRLAAIYAAIASSPGITQADVSKQLDETQALVYRSLPLFTGEFPLLWEDEAGRLYVYSPDANR